MLACQPPPARQRVQPSALRHRLAAVGSRSLLLTQIADAPPSNRSADNRDLYSPTSAPRKRRPTSSLHDPRTGLKMLAINAIVIAAGTTRASTAGESLIERHQPV